jgi:hypothetical protein
MSRAAPAIRVPPVGASSRRLSFRSCRSLSGAFLVPDFRAAELLAGGDSADALAADLFLAGAFFAVDDFLAGVFVADEVFFADDFFADVFFADDFLAPVPVVFFAVVVSAMALLSQLLAGHQSLDQLVLTVGRLVVADLAGGPQGIHLFQFRPDRHRVVELVLGLASHLVGDRHHAAQRREGRGEQPGHEAHQPVPTKS